VLILVAVKEVAHLFIVVLLQPADLDQLELAVFLWFIQVLAILADMPELAAQTMLGWQHNGTRYPNSTTTHSRVGFIEQHWY
jgi:hypothetical protein